VPFEHDPAGTNDVPEQLALPQVTVGYEHSPSARLAHAPAHGVPAPSHAARLPCGAPEATGLQVPPLPELDVGGSDDVQVSGFHDKEGAGSHTYRWTGSCATVYLPAARAATAVEITASAGRRPAVSPATVRVMLGEVPLGRFTAAGDWEVHRLEVPLEARGKGALLRLDVPGWRPANTDPSSRDVRDLGVMVDRVRVLVE